MQFTPYLLIGMIGTADEGATLYMTESKGQTELFIMLKFLGMYIAIDWQVLCGWLHVLADRDDVHSMFAQIAKDNLYLLRLFANANHQTGFCGHAPLLRFLQNIQGALVLRLRAHDMVKVWHGFDIVIENFRMCIHYDAQRNLISFKIRN